MENVGSISLRKKQVAGKLLELFELLSSDRLPYYSNNEVVVTAKGGRELIRITHEDIVTPARSLTDSVFLEPTTLDDLFVSRSQLSAFAHRIKQAIKRLDHVGFCYTVQSQEVEVQRITNSIKRTDWHLYEMQSNDQAKWYFIGNADRWQDPMIELLPALPNNDSDLPYWMPHIHVDINTSFSSDDITRFIGDVFGNTRKPMLYSDPHYGVHCMRLWLGTVAGVNINLDMSTKVRNLEWVRAHLLNKIA